MKAYSKCIAAFVSSLAATLAASAVDGLTQHDWVSALLVAIAAGATVYAAPRNADQ